MTTPTSSKSCASFLEHEGYETLAAFEGVRTVEVANKQHPDLILLDLLMPAGRGESVLKSLRSRMETEKIPVIVVTGMKKSDIGWKKSALFFHHSKAGRPFGIDCGHPETGKGLKPS